MARGGPGFRTVESTHRGGKQQFHTLAFKEMSVQALVDPGP